MIYKKNNLKYYREKNHLTQSELAFEVDVTKDYIHMLEKGTRNPSLNLAKKIANILNVSIDDIF